MFAGLALVPAFHELQAEARRKVQRIQASVTARVLSPAVLDQREADYDRGFIDGMLYVTEKIPESAQRKLDRSDDEFDNQPEQDEGSEW